MTLQSSGAISLANVNTELGRSSTASISLGETAVRNLAGVASGAIALSNLYGKSNSPSNTISLSNYQVNSYGTDVSANSSYTLSSTGDITFTISGDTNGTQDIGDWISPKSGMSGYECLATVTSGLLTGGTQGTWLNLGTSQTWSRSRGAARSGQTSCTFTLSIRQVGTTTILASATITLLAQTENTGGAVMTL